MPTVNNFTASSAVDQDWTNDVQARLGKVVQVVNNSSATYTVALGVSKVKFSGTNVTSVAMTLPAAAVAVDGQEFSMASTAAISVALTWASAGATFVGAPATLAANTNVTLTFFKATSTWELVG